MMERKPMDATRIIKLMRSRSKLELARQQIAIGQTMMEALRARRPRAETAELRNLEYDIARRVGLVLGVRFDADGAIKGKDNG